MGPVKRGPCSPIDPADLRRALGSFATGVTVVTTLDADGVPRGFTANSFTSVSLEPPLILVCLAKTAASCAVFRAAESYAVNILSEDQKTISTAFSSAIANRFAAVDWRGRSTGCPVFAGVTAWLDCRMHEVIDAGDHCILIGRIVDYDYAAASPLGYCRGAYVSFGLARDAVRAVEDDHGTRLLALIEYEETILFERDTRDGALALPGASRIGNPEDTGSLLGKVTAAGVDAELSFLFAVYEDPQSAVHTIVYRGEARAANGRAKESLIGFADIPWNAIRDTAVRALIERYVRERKEDSFGVYVGDTATGHVKPLAPSD
jgi:flavin reductase (DIM6/NTAB) family NADH-FMN oxidoreductase RutF